MASKLAGGADDVQVIGNEQMRQQLEQVKNLPAGSQLSPQKCAKLQDEYTVNDLTGSVAATASTASAERGQVIQVFSLRDAATRKQVLHALSLKDISGCEKVQVPAGGQQVAAQRQILDLKINAESALSMATSMDAGGGQKLESVTVQALDGNDFVLLTLQTGSQDAQQLAKDAEKLANRAFKEIDALKH